MDKAINEDKEFYGTLDTAARTLEDMVPVFQGQFERGKKRMRPEDIKRMEKYLARITKALKPIKSTLMQFKSLNK